MTYVAQERPAASNAVAMSAGMASVRVTDASFTIVALDEEGRPQKLAVDV